jgi:hypothetical protein
MTALKEKVKIKVGHPELVEGLVRERGEGNKARGPSTAPCGSSFDGAALAQDDAA